jgi:N-methylhydantoinase A
MLEDMEAEGRELIARGERKGRAEVRRSVDMRYLNQRYEVSVPLPGRRLAPDRLDRLEQAFRAAYRERYGREIEGVAAEAVTWRVEVSAPTVAAVEPFKAAARTQGRPATRARRRVVHDGAPVDTQVHRRADLAKGRRLNGPAIVEDAGSTCVVPPGARAHIDDMGNLVIEL